MQWRTRHLTSRHAPLRHFLSKKQGGKATGSGFAPSAPVMDQHLRNTRRPTVSMFSMSWAKLKVGRPTIRCVVGPASTAGLQQPRPSTSQITGHPDDELSRNTMAKLHREGTAPAYLERLLCRGALPECMRRQRRKPSKHGRAARLCQSMSTAAWPIRCIAFACADGGTMRWQDRIPFGG